MPPKRWRRDELIVRGAFCRETPFQHLHRGWSAIPGRCDDELSGVRLGYVGLRVNICRAEGAKK